MQFGDASAAKPPGKRKGPKEIRVWESMNLDAKMSPGAVEKRKQTQKMMEDMEESLIPHIEATTWPDFVFPAIEKLKINGL